MSKLNIAIYKLTVLYEILIEIKSELNFNLFNFTENDENFKKFIKNNPESLIISSEANKDFKNLIFYNKTFKLKKLLQQINIYLSKSNYGIKSNISIGKYKIDTNSRLISNNSLSLKLTEREIDLIIYLNNSKDEKTTNLFIDKPEPFIKNYKFIKGFEGGSLSYDSLEKNGFSRVEDRPYYVEGIGNTKVRPHFELLNRP